MMEIEKRLAQADLKGIQKDQQLRALARDIVKYQLFKTSKAIHKIQSCFSKSTTASYFNAGVGYLRHNTQKAGVNQNLYKLIQEYVDQHTQPLVPSKSEKARILPSRSQKPRKAKITTIKLDLPKQVTEQFVYGVKKDNHIIIMPSEQAVTQFIDVGHQLYNDQNIVGITLTIQPMNIQ